jgi:uncharacterized protein YkwD
MAEYIRSIVRGDEAMRVALLSLMVITIITLAFPLGGCSSIPFGNPAFNVQSPDGNPYRPQNNSIEKLSKAELAAGKLPDGTYDKAPAGAFNDRDYRHVKLNPHDALKLINAYRASKGLGKVSINSYLTKTAKQHSRDLAKHDRISHYGSDGSNPWDRVERSGYKPQLAAENVGTGQLTIKEVMQGWKDSPGHNKNLLLPDAKHMGIALVYDPKTEYKTFWTLILGGQS